MDVTHGEHLQVRLNGEVDVSNADIVRRTLSAALDTDHEVTLDLANVRFMDATAITTIMSALRERDGAVVHMTNPRPTVRRLVELAGIGYTLRGDSLP